MNSLATSEQASADLCLPDLETGEQALPVVVVDGLPARQLGSNRLLETLELDERLAGEQVCDLALDGRVRVATLGSAKLLQTGSADSGHRLRAVEKRPR